MPTPLSHRPFMALNARKARREPDRTLVDVGQKQPSSARVHELFSSPLPVTQPAESEPEPVAEKKSGPKKGYKRSPESIAKQKTTLASKKRKAARASNKANGTGEKAAFIRANPDIPVPELIELARKQGLSITQTHAYQVRRSGKGRATKTQPKPNGPSSNDASITELLQAIIDATSEIARRLSQLTL